jgi:hypothetical protein
VKAATLDLDREERIRRFWKAHARSYAHLTLLHAFCNNPEIAWTPEHLSDWYGLRIDRTRVVARELAACGILRPSGGEGEEYRWNPALAWVDPASPAGRDFLRAAWTIRDVVTGGLKGSERTGRRARTGSQ